MGYIQRTPNAQDIPWMMAWLQGELEGMFVGVSLSLLNGGCFPIDDIPDSLMTLEAYSSRNMR